MKLLVTLDFPPEIGGIQRYLSDIVRHTFSAEDCVLTGCTVPVGKRNDGAYPCRIVRVGAGSRMVPKKVLLAPLLFLVLLRVLRRRNATTVFAGNIYTGLLCALISYVIPLQFRVYCYGTELLPLRKKGSLRWRVWKLTLRRAEEIYYLTEATRELITLCGGCGPCIKIPPRIDLPKFQICRKVQNDGIVHILSVGRLVPHKGHEVLLDAVSGLQLTVPWLLAVVGSGPEHARLDGLVRSRALEHRILFTGEIPESRLVELYMAADIFILPSIETAGGVEGFGIVLLEAMAYGAAIIASRSGGITEVFDGRLDCAALVPPGDPDALRRSLITLLTDGERRYRMTRSARRLLEERYVWR